MSKPSRQPIEIFGLVVRPLTIRQVERIQEVVMKAADAGASLSVTSAQEIVAAALARDHGEVDVLDIECDIASLTGAMRAVLQLGGFVPGEASAAAGASAKADGDISEAA